MNSILLVDDDPQLLQVLQRQFEAHSAEWELTTASNGSKALGLVKLKAFDLIITDILMPERDGFEIIAELRTIRPLVKIIAMSGGGRHVGLDFLRVAKALGANAILTKPFSIGVLIESMRTTLSQGSPAAPFPSKAESSDVKPIAKLRPD